jgi:nitrogen fixation NifU-like protein
MTDALCGKTIAAAELLFERFHALLTSDEAKEWESMGKLAVLAGVKAYPARVKCATLAWHTFHAALSKTANVVSTE